MLQKLLKSDTLNSVLFFQDNGPIYLRRRVRQQKNKDAFKDNSVSTKHVSETGMVFFLMPCCKFFVDREVCLVKMSGDLPLVRIWIVKL